VGPIDGPPAITPDDDWIAPAFWDIQTNGRWGVSFSDPTLTVEQVAEMLLVGHPAGHAASIVGAR
jgi:N-acetylglucosamine-6-phosphate deacetylase